ncbi:MAG: arginine--tRNA ligase [Dehalococcoidaceae bacterium]|nr:arginine--tRNA ligase [Dehalococcoidaceae bacterium]
MIQKKLSEILQQAIQNAQNNDLLNDFAIPAIDIDRPANPAHGDYASNVALKIQPLTEKSPMDNGQIILDHISENNLIQEATLAKPGFINFKIQDHWLAEQIKNITNDNNFGGNDTGKGLKLQIEYVSSNPTGPVHIGNGRGASIGSSLAKIFRKCSYEVTEEFYVNDAGNQIKLFGETLFARYSTLLGVARDVPDEGYQGQYMIELAKQINDEHGNTFLEASKQDELTKIGLAKMITEIQLELSNIGVEFSEWFYESSLHDNKTLTHVITQLESNKFTAKKDDAIWFTSTKLGDEKDNVLIKADGTPTYFTADIAYHHNKFRERNFDRVINIWGADHQGHVTRLKKAMQALDINAEQLDIILYQLITLKRGNETVPLSKRSGEIISLNEVFTETGKDAMRFFFLAQSANQAMDFDVELAKQQTKDNPVYYVQYAHARIYAILAKAKEEQFSASTAHLSLIHEAEEITLIKKLIEFPELIQKIADDLAPHHLPHYAMELAQSFHAFYTKCRVIDESNKNLSEARLELLEACKIVLAETLLLIGVDAPNKM